MSPALPPELIEQIINYLPNYPFYLRRAALISRVWAIPCQRALFRSLDLSFMNSVAQHLRRYPHLQSHIRHVILSHKQPRNPPKQGYLAALTAMFTVMPQLTSLEITFDRYRPWRMDDELFFSAFTVFLRGTPSLNAVDIHGLADQLDFQQMFSCLENTALKRVSLQLDSYDDRDDYELVDFFSPTLAVVRLPQIEMIRFQLWHAVECEEGLKFWFTEHQTMFPGLKHLEIAVDDIDDFILWFRTILQPLSTLRLKSFRMGFDAEALAAPGSPLPITNLFDGLHFDHLKFGLYMLDFVDDFEPSAQEEFYIWLSSVFRLLTADSVHFTELTFAVAAAFQSGAMWDALDDALSLEVFGKVEHIYFETRKDRIGITDLEHPDLAPKIRGALPRLDGRGVLCFL